MGQLITASICLTDIPKEKIRVSEKKRQEVSDHLHIGASKHLPIRGYAYDLRIPNRHGTPDRTTENLFGIW